MHMHMHIGKSHTSTLQSSTRHRFLRSAQRGRGPLRAPSSLQKRAAPTSAAHPRSHRSQQEQRDRARSSIRTGCPLVDSEEETGS